MSYKVYGGVHPSAFKTLASDRPIKRALIPKKVIIPLLQHTGSPAEPVISVGAGVSVGDMIAKPSGYISSAIHASISGKVTKIAYSPTRVQPRVLSVTIESQGDEDQDIKLKPGRATLDGLSREAVVEMIRDAGVVGLGGAVFPTHVKLSPPKTKPIDTVIINGAECEPYLTCDHRLMIEKSFEILKGLYVITWVLGVKNGYVAIEDNKMSAIYAMEKALSVFKRQFSGVDVKIVALETKYPQGAEKQVIKAILNRVVPAGALPMDVGCVVQNVGTAFGIYEAVCHGKPLIERAVTITGSCLREPANIWVRIGTMLREVVDYAGGLVKDPAKVIVGGPMTGVAQFTLDIPVTKGVSGVVFLSKEEVDESKETVCIRCGKCIEVCPMGLAPTALMYRVKKENFAGAKELGVLNCYECGACAYACPAKIPLLDYMKYGKSKVTVV